MSDLYLHPKAQRVFIQRSYFFPTIMTEPQFLVKQVYWRYQIEIFIFSTLPWSKAKAFRQLLDDAGFKNYGWVNEQQEIVRWGRE